jgi:hypothetical protein
MAGFTLCSTLTPRQDALAAASRVFRTYLAIRAFVHWSRRRPVISSADYGAIELRIAAALAERAIADLRSRVKGDVADEWFLRHVLRGMGTTKPVPCPEEPERWDLNWLNQAIPAVAQTVFRRPVQRMMSIFKRRLDPHLVTAIDMARRSGKIACGDDASG